MINRILIAFVVLGLLFVAASEVFGLHSNNGVGSEQGFVYFEDGSFVIAGLAGCNPFGLCGSGVAITPLSIAFVVLPLLLAGIIIKSLVKE